MECAIKAGDFSLAVSATDICRNTGFYTIRVTAESNSLTKRDEEEITFRLFLKLNTANWYPKSPAGINLGEIDISAFAIIFSISIIVSFFMVFLIHRTRQRLTELQNRHLEIYAAQHAGISPPMLYSVQLPESISADQRGISEQLRSKPSRFFNRSESFRLLHDDGEAIANAGSASTLSSTPSKSGWIARMPRFLSKITSSLSNFDLFQRTQNQQYVCLLILF